MGEKVSDLRLYQSLDDIPGFCYGGKSNSSCLIYLILRILPILTYTHSILECSIANYVTLLP